MMLLHILFSLFHGAKYCLHIFLSQSSNYSYKLLPPGGGFPTEALRSVARKTTLLYVLTFEWK